mgnify:CR=1 FL=1
MPPTCRGRPSAIRQPLTILNDDSGMKRLRRARWRRDLVHGDEVRTCLPFRERQAQVSIVTSIGPQDFGIAGSQRMIDQFRSTRPELDKISRRCDPARAELQAERYATRVEKTILPEAVRIPGKYQQVPHAAGGTQRIQRLPGGGVSVPWIEVQGKAELSIPCEP